MPSIQLSEIVSAAEDVHLIDNDTNNENIYEKSVTDYKAGHITRILMKKKFSECKQFLILYTVKSDWIELKQYVNCHLFYQMRKYLN